MRRMFLFCSRSTVATAVSDLSRCRTEPVRAARAAARAYQDSSSRLRDPVRSRTLLRAADDTDAAFFKPAIRQLMQHIDHAVVTTRERAKDAGPFLDVEVKCAHDICATFPVRYIFHIASGKRHRQRAARQVVNRQITGKLDVEVPDCATHSAVMVSRTIAAAVSLWKSTNRVNLRCAVRPVIEIHI